MSKSNNSNQVSRKFDTLPDPTDFRDKLFEPTLIEVPPRIDLKDYLDLKVPVLDQKNEGACTGFGLATVAHYLLRRRRVDPDQMPVSPRMFYEMAKRYDEWPGETYEGSSARGAMKGWHKHGVCSEELWPYVPEEADRTLSSKRVSDAIRRPLGAYYRVNHKDLVAMHSALAEVGIFYATAIVHEGWYHPDNKGWIKPDERVLGGHAFAIVAYDENGFWIQNSWGDNWGQGGLGLLTYDDWLDHGMDVWVARLGAPVILRTAKATSKSLSNAAGQSDAYAFCDVRPHIVSVGNDGHLRPGGTYGTSKEDVKRIFDTDFPTFTQGWGKKRLLLYAHGGLTGEMSAIQRIADYRPVLLENEVYPIAFVWKTDFWTTLKNIIEDALRRRRPEEALGSGKDFLLDRLDDALEPAVRTLAGKLQWDEMKENGLRATATQQGAGRIVLENLARLLQNDPQIEIHMVAHSAGSIFLAPFIQLLTASGDIDSGPMKGKNGYGLKIKSCTLWAPAVTANLFKETYVPAIKSKALEQFALYTLTDAAEQDDNCANIYHKSLLYLVSNALEETTRIPLIRPEGESILGMEKFVNQDKEIKALFNQQAEWVLAPNHNPESSTTASRSQHHGDFDDDRATLLSTIARILANTKATGAENLAFAHSASKLRDQREQINTALVTAG